MKHDAIYARYSSHAQDDGTSIEVQIEQCERAAGGKCHRYIDRAKTGRAMGGRDQMLAMLADAEAGKIKRVFVYKFDRLGRSADTHIVAQQLDDAGVELISATEGTNALARGIQLVVAEEYSRQLAQRTRDGLLKRFEQGAFTGGVAPYGYCVQTKDGRRVLAIEPAEAEIVREVVHWYLCEAIGFKSIAKRLRDRQVSSRRGSGWSFTSVRALLMNPVLTGSVRFNARRMHLDRVRGKRVPRFRPVADHEHRQDESLRIVDDATFQKIQERIGKAARGQSPRAPRGIGRFTALVYCQCGAKCYRVKSENKKGTYFYYVCGRHLSHDDCKTSGRVREDKLVEVVNGRVARVFEHEKEIIERALALATEASKGNRDETARLKSELAEAESDQARLVELLMDRDISADAKKAISRKMTDTEARHAGIIAAIERLHTEANDNVEGLAAIIRETFEMARENLAAAATPAEFNRFVEQFVGAMTVTPDGTVTQKKTPVADATGVNSNLIRSIAGGGFEPPTSGL